MRISVRFLRPCRMISCPAANGIRCVKPSSASDWPSRTWRAMASRSERNSTLTKSPALVGGDERKAASLESGKPGPRSRHQRARLLAQVMREVIERGDRVSRGPGALPAAERLVARPRARGRALRPVRVGHAGLDALEEPCRLVLAAVEAGGEAERRGVRERHAG